MNNLEVNIYKSASSNRTGISLQDKYALPRFECMGSILCSMLIALITEKTKIKLNGGKKIYYYTFAKYF